LDGNVVARELHHPQIALHSLVAMAMGAKELSGVQKYARHTKQHASSHVISSYPLGTSHVTTRYHGNKF